MVRLHAMFAEPVCFAARNWPYVGESRGLAPGTTLDGVREVWLCVQEPALWQRVLGFVADAAGPCAYVSTLLVLLLVLKRAAHEGVHTFDTAVRVRRLGHYLLWVVLGATCVASIARTTLVHAAVTYDAGTLAFFGEWDVPWWAVVTGAGLLTLAKIMRASAEMRADLEGTV
ncbi:hypothetical protein LZG04_00025 [Saccharothrix sp. S26]|uniref:hypothetical protein n=1 Tax=Saccharothrix sp. S26 TaxID=2907215 RepID=UPI001F37A76A|nr:hypothetical protein [Saccharothrix sp. S26]MCE6993205.1 hypothetical protein [Saccharothrix sp. S26]